MIMKNRYVLRVYNENYSFGNYNDDIYAVPETEVNKPDLEVEVYADTGEKLLQEWYKFLEKWEGYTYCVKDLYFPDEESVVVGGIYSRGDDEILLDSLVFSTEREERG